MLMVSYDDTVQPPVYMTTWQYLCLQTCQLFKVTSLEILAKNHKKPGDSVKNLENLASHFFRRDKFKEHFK